MPAFAGKVTCGDGYTNAATIEGVWDSAGGSFALSNADGDAIVQLQAGPVNQGQWGAEAYVPAGSSAPIYAGTTGIRFRNAVAGAPAVVISCSIAGKREPALTIAAGPGAAATPTQTAVTGDYKISAVGASHDDPSGGRWLLCDGSAIDPQYATLIALVGGSTPDARGRVPVMQGTNGDVGFLATDGVALASRTPKHGTSSTLGVTAGTLAAAFTGTPGTTGTESATHTHQYLERPDAANSLGTFSATGPAQSNTTASTGTESATHTHSFTPAGSVAISGAPALTGSVGASGSRPADTPAFLVPGNLFIHT